MRPCRPETVLAAALLAVVVGSLPAQERVVTQVLRTYLDASFSPDGQWVAYQAGGILYSQRVTGGGEVAAYDATQTMTYFWESNSSSFLIFGQGILMQVSRDGLTRKRIAALDTKGIQDFFFISPDQRYLYGVRRDTSNTYVCRVQLSTGALEDLISTIPGITSLDVDPSGSKLLITSAVYLFTYQFFLADLDGKNVVLVNQTALPTVTNHGRWVDSGKSFIFEHTGTYASLGSGSQLFTMDAATAAYRPLTWRPKHRKGVPTFSPDRQWLAMPETLPGTGTSRILLFPASGGGDVVLTAPMFQVGDRVRFAPDGKSVAYVGAAKQTDLPAVRIYAFDRPLRLAPTARPGDTSQVTLPLASTEAGVVFLGFSLASSGLPVPPLTGTFDLDLTAGVLLLYAGAQQDLVAPFVVPNDTAFIGQAVLLQSVRLATGPQLQGELMLPLHVAIAPN